MESWSILSSACNVTVEVPGELYIQGECDSIALIIDHIFVAPHLHFLLCCGNLLSETNILLLRTI